MKNGWIANKRKKLWIANKRLPELFSIIKIILRQKILLYR